MIPLGRKFIELAKGFFAADRPVDCFEIGGHLAPVLPGNESQRVSNQMYNAELHLSFRKNAANRFWKTFETVDTGDENILHAAILELRHHLQPEFGPLGFLNPEPEDFLLPLHVHANGHIHGFAADMTGISHFYEKRVQENDRVNRVQHPVLPDPDFLHDCIGHLRDQVGRYIYGVDFLEMFACTGSAIT